MKTKLYTVLVLGKDELGKVKVFSKEYKNNHDANNDYVLVLKGGVVEDLNPLEFNCWKAFFIEGQILSASSNPS